MSALIVPHPAVKLSLLFDNVNKKQGAQHAFGGSVYLGKSGRCRHGQNDIISH